VPLKQAHDFANWNVFQGSFAQVISVHRVIELTRNAFAFGILPIARKTRKILEIFKENATAPVRRRFAGQSMPHADRSAIGRSDNLIS